jgi:hypothetical protein
LLAAAVWAFPAAAQTELTTSGGAPAILTSDLAVLASSDQRDDLPCRVTWEKPAMAFDLRYHATYRVEMPLRGLAGDGNQLRILLRVTPEDAPGNTMFLKDRFSVPAIEENAKGEAYIGGEFTVGPGRYRVDWLMRDRTERVCSMHWAIEAKADEDLEQVELAIAPNTVEPRPHDPFSEAPPVDRDGNPLLRVKLLVNFAPTDLREAALKPWDVQAITSILRTISREPTIGTFRLVAFNMHEEKVIYRQDEAGYIDFPGLGEAVSRMEIGTIDFQRLQDPESDVRFLATLLTEHAASEQPLDAIIIVGPKVMLDDKVPEGSLKQAATSNVPVFYFNYNSNPRKNPWRDTIATALKAYRGLAYSITFPKDLGSAMNDMMLRLTRRQP